MLFWATFIEKNVLHLPKSVWRKDSEKKNNRNKIFLTVIVGRLLLGKECFFYLNSNFIFSLSTSRFVKIFFSVVNSYNYFEVIKEKYIICLFQISFITIFNWSNNRFSGISTIRKLHIFMEYIRADEPSDRKWLPPPVDTCNTRDLTSALPVFAGSGEGVGYGLLCITRWNTAQAMI